MTHPTGKQSHSTQRSDRARSIGPRPRARTRQHAAGGPRDRRPGGISSRARRPDQQLIAYCHMWYPGQPAAEQCEGCTFYNGQVRELSYLHSSDVTYATFCQGPYEESVRYRDFMGWEVPWFSVVADSAEEMLAGRTFNRFYLVFYLRQGERVFETYWTSGRAVEVMAPTYGLLDKTVYGRQEAWEDSPAGWLQRDESIYRTNGRPTAQ